MIVESPKLSDLVNVLRDHHSSAIRVVLPDGEVVPSHFHVTEVGRVQKDFIDCGGTKRRLLSGQLQLLVAGDFEHRLKPEKLLGIIEKSASILGDDPLPLTIEHGQKVAVVYEVSALELVDSTVELRLLDPLTGCLAPDSCGLPADEKFLDVSRGAKAFGGVKFT